MHAPCYIIICGLSGCTIFSTLSHKWHNFRRKRLLNTNCVLIFSATFVWNISHSKKNSARYYHRHILLWTTRWRSWLRHSATNRKVACSIPDGVIGIFHWHNPSGRTMALGVDSASNRNEYQEYYLGVKAAGAYGWQPYHLHVPIVLKSGSLNLLQPSGPVQACNGIALPFFRI